MDRGGFRRTRSRVQEGVEGSWGWGHPGAGGFLEEISGQLDLGKRAGGEGKPHGTVVNTLKQAGVLALTNTQSHKLRSCAVLQAQPETAGKL